MIERLRARISAAVKENEPMAKYTTFKIGGPARFFYEAKSAEDAVRAAEVAKELDLPLFIFGGGSNLLISDNGLEGLVVRMANRGLAFEGARVKVEAGAPTGLVSIRSVEAGLAGFEWAVGLPGTIGGAVRGNAGMFGGEMKDAVEEAVVLRGGTETRLAGSDCGFAYRDSAFKREPGAVILSITLRLAESSDTESSKALLKKNLFEKKNRQPIEYACAGCVFTNWRPAAGEADFEKLRASFNLGREEKIPVTSQGTVPAGWIIDRSGLKGARVGRVSVSGKHGNFLVNDGRAAAGEVVELIAAVKTRVSDITRGTVRLAEEIEYAGFQ